MEMLSKFAERAVATPSTRAVAVAGAFVLAAALKHALVTALIYFHSPRFYLRAQDAVLTGALAALMVWALLVAVAARRRYVRQQIEAVANLNHELRNALQVILGSEYLPKTDKADAILESVERINNNLSRLLGQHSR
jgi:signal transduction histidine kinase